MTLRTGWTTGTCASAAAKAAVTGLRTGTCPSSVEVALPSGARVSFEVDALARHVAVVVKDAGDDPDCTDGAHMTATAAWADSGLTLLAGDGIGTVTRPGLGIEIGAPSITPVPRRMIELAVREALEGDPRGISLTFSVPGGLDMAGRTSNERLGIEGGISILGTTGIVKPFSTAAYRASVVQQIDVAAAQGVDTVVLATGSRSDVAAQRLRPDLDLVSFVEVGDYTGVALRRAAARHIPTVVWVGMVGKITKLAAGVMMTHFRRSTVDGSVLASAAEGASDDVLAAATATATARHFYEVCVARGEVVPLQRLCTRAASALHSFVDGALDVEVVMVDFDGDAVVARS